jgi:YD repeat-containing protein
VGLPGLVTTTSSTPTEAAQSRKLHYTFNSDCSVDTITDESDTDTTKQLRTEFGYDRYGNVDTVSEYPVASPSSARTTTFQFDAYGQFQEYVTIGGVNLTTHLGWDPLLGLRTSVTSPDGLTTSYEHDAFGRLTRETRPAGITDYDYLECSVCFPLHADYFVRASDTSGAIAYTFFDRLARPVGRETPLAGGARSREEILYEATGRVDKHTQPYVAGETRFWVDETYDLLGRLLSEDAPIDEAHPSGAITGYDYRGPEVWVTDPKSHVSKYRHNALGQIEQVTDALGGETAYAYYPFGELHTVTDDDTHTTTLTYDPRGYKSGMEDPDLGTWHYDFNAFGQLEEQTDAKSQTVTLAYDAAGRLDYRDEPEGHTDFDYYLATAGTGQRGRLREVTSPGDLGETYVYSTSVPGAPTEVTRSIGTANYTFDYAYDTEGRSSS